MFLCRNLSTLVLLEQKGNKLVQSSLCAIRAAAELGSKEISALLVGSDNTESEKELASVPGLKTIYSVKNESLKNNISETIAPIIKDLQEELKFTHILSAHTAFAKNVIPRLGALLDVNPITDITEIIDSKTFSRPIYAGNAISVVESNDEIRLLTVRPTMFPVVLEQSGEQIEIVQKSPKEHRSKVEWVKEEIMKSERPDLLQADVVVAGGRGLKSAENFKLIYSLADKLNAGVGASRAAVDAGYVSNDLQIGQTGKIIAPKLYIAVGISGAIQHLAGINDSKTIVAINKDPEAPIFSISDIGIVGDLFKIVPEMTNKL